VPAIGRLKGHSIGLSSVPLLGRSARSRSCASHKHGQCVSGSCHVLVLAPGFLKGVKVSNVFTGKAAGRSYQGAQHSLSEEAVMTPASDQDHPMIKRQRGAGMSED